MHDLKSTVAHITSLEAGVNERDLRKEENLNKVLIDLKRRKPSSSSWIYQSIKNSWAWKKFFIDTNITSFVGELLIVNVPRNLGVVSLDVRFDIPGDSRNIRTWLRVGNYFLENSRDEDQLVV